MPHLKRHIKHKNAMFILPAFDQTIQRLAGPGLGHNTRHVYVGDGIGDVVRPLISAGAKAAGRLAAKGLVAARNLGVELFQAAKPVALRAATEAAAAGKDILRQRAQALLVPRVRTATHRAGPPKQRKQPRATIQQKARELLSGRAAKNLDTLIWGQGLRLSPY